MDVTTIKMQSNNVTTLNDQKIREERGVLCKSVDGEGNFPSKFTPDEEEELLKS